MLTDTPSEMALAAALARVHELEAERDAARAKLRRVCDAIRFAANADGGLVAEIEETLRSDAENGGADGGRSTNL